MHSIHRTSNLSTALAFVTLILGCSSGGSSHTEATDSLLNAPLKADTVPVKEEVASKTNAMDTADYSTNANKSTTAKEVVASLQKANTLFQEAKQQWLDGDGIFENVDVYKKSEWVPVFISYCQNSGYFSETFIEKMQNVANNSDDPHIGELFYQDGLGKLLHSLCDKKEESLLNNLHKEGEHSYRHVVPYSKVLNSVPIPDQEEGFDWLWEKGDNGETWMFSILFIDQEGQWVIHKIERFFGTYN